MHINNPKWLPLAIILVGVIFSTVLAHRQQVDNQTVAERRFLSRSKRSIDQINAQMSIYEYGLRGARGTVIGAGGENISEERFTAYGESLDLGTEFPGARGYGFIRRVKPEEEAAFIASERSRNRPDFHIRQFVPHAGEKYIVQYFVPESSNPVIGLDIASEPNRKRALEDAINSGHATLSPPISLAFPIDIPNRGFLMVLPVYRAGLATATPAERQAATFGWVYAPLLIDEVMKRLDYRDGELSVTLTGQDINGHLTRFFASPHSELPTIGDLTYNANIQRYGQVWHVQVKALPRFITNQNLISPLEPALIVMACALLLAGLSYFYLLNVARRLKALDTQARLAAIVEGSNDAIIGKTLEGVVTSWNSAAQAMFGYSAQEAIGHTIRELVVPPDRVQEEIDILARVSNGENVPHFETIRQRKDGSTLQVSVTVSPIRGEHGQIEGAAKTVRDISAQKEAQAQVLRLNATLEQQVQERTAQIQAFSALQQAILDSAGYSIIATDSDGMIKLFNPAAERLLGYEAGEMIGLHTPATIHDPAEVAARAAALSEELKRPVEAGFEVFTAKLGRGKPDSNEWTYIRKDGTRVPVLLTTSSLRDNYGKIFGYLGMAVDLTARKQDETILRQAKESAESATRAKSDFLANMSHEIRTPMNAILGMLQLLQQTELSNRQYDYTEKAESAAKALLGLLNDILDFSKVEAGKLELDPHPFMLDKLLRDIGVILSASVGKKDIEILFDVDSSLPDMVVGDALRLQQVLINLSGNAIKFTERGEVVLSVHLKRQRDNQLTLYFAVRDTGIGINPEQLSHVFDGFSQAEVSTTRRFGGTGLGLAISQRLVHLMGGKLEVESQVGKGSTFHFEITMQTLSEESIEHTSAMPALANLRGVRALVVDDNASAREVISRMVDSLGWHADLAASGLEALSLLEQSIQRNRVYDVIFVDWAMPDMDGWQTAEHIRQISPASTSPLIVMVTAYGREMLAQRLASEQALLDGFLVKPITTSTLFDAVADARANQNLLSVPVKKTPVNAQRLAGLRLLLVEDNPTNQQVARELLRNEGAHVDVAGGGVDGVAAVQAANPQYDAVLMDIQMPDMDGYAATREIRHKLGLHTLPIIAMTANAMASDRLACLDAGMDEHIGKPFDLNQLVSVIRQFTRSTTSPLPTPPVLQKGRGIIPPAALKLAGERGLDISVALARLGGDLSLFEWALGSFLTSSPQTIEQLAAWKPGTPAEPLGRLLHTLKGTAGTVGATDLALLVRQVEMAMANDIDETELAVQLADIRMGLEQTSTDVKALAALLQAAQAPGIPPQSTSDPALATELENLSRLLASANMQAMHVFEQIKHGLSATYPEHSTRIGQAIDALDFQSARSQCEAILEKLKN